LETINKSFQTNINKYSREALDHLVRYSWPGNVRQLIHILEQIAINAWEVQEIITEHLPREVFSIERGGNGLSEASFNKLRGANSKERDSIISALKQTRGNKRQAAMLIGMPRSTFYQKIEKYGIQVLLPFRPPETKDGL